MARRLGVEVVGGLYHIIYWFGIGCWLRALSLIEEHSIFCTIYHFNNTSHPPISQTTHKNRAHHERRCRPYECALCKSAYRRAASDDMQSVSQPLPFFDSTWKETEFILTPDRR